MRNDTVHQTDRVPLEDIDLFDEERYRTSSQHAAWHTLRAEAPVWAQESRDGTRFWSVTRYADVLRVIKDHRAFSSENGTILAVLGGDSAGGRTINLMDLPRHKGIRVPTMKLLSTSAVHRITDRLRQRVRDLVAPLREGGELDLVPLMLRLPMLVVGDIIGIPESYWGDVARWTMAGVAPEDPVYLQESREETLRNVHFELFAMFHDVVADRKVRPREDIASILLGLEIDGEKLSYEEVVLNCYSFSMGANTTTPHVASQLLLGLAERPEQWRALRAGESDVDRAVEEGLRWATPTNHLVRAANTDVEIAGTRIAKGEQVCAWVASANRDERVFARPYEFDTARAYNPHIAFGNGIHYCNGAPGARLVLRLLLEELLPVVDGWQLAGPVRHLRSNFINGITELPVDVRPDPVPRPRPAAAVAGCPVHH